MIAVRESYLCRRWRNQHFLGCCGERKNWMKGKRRKSCGFSAGRRKSYELLHKLLNKTWKCTGESLKTGKFLWDFLRFSIPTWRLELLRQTFYSTYFSFHHRTETERFQYVGKCKNKKKITRIFQSKVKELKMFSYSF